MVAQGQVAGTAPKARNTYFMSVTLSVCHIWSSVLSFPLNFLAPANILFMVSTCGVLAGGR